MASTRNKNSLGNYCCERNRYNMRSNYILNNTQSEFPKLAGNGLIQGPMYSSYLANNSIDIESFLRGIRSTDFSQLNCSSTSFYTSHPILQPEFKTLPHFNLYCNQSIIMPESFTPSQNERPKLA
jgi:hypothetical protein